MTKGEQVRLMAWLPFLERPDVEESTGVSEPAEASSRHLEHIFLPLSTIVAREPLDLTP